MWLQLVKRWRGGLVLSVRVANIEFGTRIYLGKWKFLDTMVSTHWSFYLKCNKLYELINVLTRQHFHVASSHVADSWPEMQVRSPDFYIWSLNNKIAIIFIFEISNVNYCLLSNSFECRKLTQNRIGMSSCRS